MGDTGDLAGRKDFSVVTQWLRARTSVGLLAAVLLPLVALGIRLTIGEVLTGFPFLLFFPAILGAAFIGGWPAGVLATVLAELLSVYFLIPPYRSFSVGGLPGAVALGFFNLVCGTIIALVHALSSAMMRLGSATDALQRGNDLLELRVVERTRELADANAALRAEIATRQAMEAQVLQTQKLEAVGQLTGGIAHDFNNMLQAVSGSLDLMRRRVGQGRAEQVGRYLDAAADATARAAQLTQQLLAFARRQTLAPVPVDPNALIVEMAELIRRTIGPGIEVSLQLREHLKPVLCDPAQLEAALMNLALNARDAMPAGGMLTIATRLCAPGGQGEPMGVEIAVTDSGIGMSEDVLAHAFEPFFTTKPIGRGTGLGLSQLYGFIRQSHGQVRIESASGKGTTVRMFLPQSVNGLRADPVEASKREPATVGVTAGTVLLVEDESVVRSVAAEALRELGCRVLEAGHGPEALRLLEAEPIPDLLVTDVGLPGGLNGRQLADAMRERRPDLPVLLITGYAGGALEGQLEPGMEVLTKPFPLESLVCAVRRTLAPAEARPG